MTQARRHGRFGDLATRERAVRRVRTRTARGRLLSDMLGDTFGGEWLSTVIPSFKAKVAGQYCRLSIRLLLEQRRDQHCSVFIAAVAALFDDADDALSVLLA